MARTHDLGYGMSPRPIVTNPSTGPLVGPRGPAGSSAGSASAPDVDLAALVAAIDRLTAAVTALVGQHRPGEIR